MFDLAILVIISYLLGSIPSAYIAGRIKKGLDIRNVGTGNVGATNVLLVVGPLFAALVYIFDLLKGLVPVLIAREIIGTEFAMGLCGMAAILGHDFSIFLGFSGGKGVATTTGAAFGLHAVSMAILFLMWLIFSFITNNFIIASLLCMVGLPVSYYLLKLSWVTVGFGAIFFLLGLFTHRRDVAKIISGQGSQAISAAQKFFRKNG